MKALAVAVSILAVGAVSASAADMAVKAPVLKAEAPYNWTGWYVGGNVGYSWGSSDANYVQDPGVFNGFGVNGVTGLALNRSLSPGSVIGGVQGGYDYQAGQWVFGVVADFDYRSGKAQVATGALNTFGDSLSISANQEWLGTIRGRVGFTPASAWLIYATGGFAYGRANYTVTQSFLVPPPILRVFSGSVNKPGWTVGAGTEYRFNRNWSVGVEYLYVDLGTDTMSVGPGSIAPLPAGTFPSTRVSFKDTSNIARVTLNYRFGGPVANY
jgi:outer membrane immunogenic protein